MTFLFVSGFNECLNLFQDYYFTAILYGSITHILKSREVLINILYKYSSIYNTDEHVFTIFKLLVLNGNVKDIKYYNTILSNKFKIDLAKLSKELWSISKNTDESRLVFPNSSYLPNFNQNNANYRDLSNAHTGPGGYLTLKNN